MEVFWFYAYFAHLLQYGPVFDWQNMYISEDFQFRKQIDAFGKDTKHTFTHDNIITDSLEMFYWIHDSQTNFS